MALSPASRSKRQKQQYGSKRNDCEASIDGWSFTWIDGRIEQRVGISPCLSIRPYAIRVRVMSIVQHCKDMDVGLKMQLLHRVRCI